MVAFITVEEKDEPESVALQLSKEIQKACKEIGRDDIVIVSFAHLSNSMAKSK